MAKISIIIPCYNIEKYIGRCFESIERQTIGIENLEIIFVEDGSTDNTYECLLDIEKRYSDSVIIIRNPVNGKPGMARNIGLEYASSEYILFIDGDDWVDEEYCKTLYDIAINNSCDLVMCNVVRDFGDGRKINLKNRCAGNEILSIDSDEQRKKIIAEDRLGDCCYPKLIKKLVLIDNDIYFPEGIVFEDITWGAICYGYFSKIGFCDKYYYHYFVNQDSVVLKKNQNYYMDMITANEIKWAEWEKRKMFERYPKEAEFDFLVSYYIGTLTMFAMHYDEIPLDAFEHIQEFIKEKTDNPQSNPYIELYLSNKNKNLFYFMDKKMDRETLAKLHELIKDKNF